MDVAQLSISVDSTDVPKATGAMDKMANAGGALEGIIQKVTAAWAGWEVVKYAKEAALLAARYETMGVVMQVAGNNAGYTGAQMAALEKSMQATGISMLESRNALTNLATANIDLASATKIARSAQDLAVVGNLNSSDALATMIHGIKSGQTEILRTMGLNVQFEEGYKTMAATLGKHVQNLTAQEKTQSRVNQVLQEATKYTGIYEAAMGTAGKQLLSMERFTENLQVQLGALFGPALSAGIQMFTGDLKGASSTMDRLTASGDVQIWGMKIKDAFKDAAGVIGGATKFLWDHRDAIVVLGAAYLALRIGPTVNAWATALGAWFQMVTRTTQAQLVYNSATMAYTTAVEASTMATRGLAAASAMASATMAALLSPIGILIAVLGTAAAAWYYFKDATEGSSKDAVQAANERIDEATRKLQAIQRAKAALAAGDKSSDAGWAADDEWQVVKLTKAYGEAQSAVLKYTAAHEKFLQMEKPSQVVGAPSYVTGADISTARDEQQFQNAQKHLQETIEARGKLVAVLNQEHAATKAVEDARIKSGQDNRDSQTTPTKYNEHAYDQLNEGLQKQLYLLKEGARAAFEHDLQIAKNKDGTQKYTQAEQALGLATWDEIKAEKDAQALRNAIYETKHTNTMRELDEMNQMTQAKNAFTIQELDAATKIQDEDAKTYAQKQKLSELYATGGVTEQQFSDRMMELTKQAHVQTETFGDLRDTIQNWSKSSTDAFVEFCWTGKSSFSDLISSMIKDLARLAVQKQIMDPLFSGSGDWMSGIFGGATNGGSTSTGWTDPGTDMGTITPMASFQAPAAAASSTTVSVGAIHINAASGDASTDSVAADALSQKLVKAMAATARAVIGDEKRPGGLLSTARA